MRKNITKSFYLSTVRLSSGITHFVENHFVKSHKDDKNFAMIISSKKNFDGSLCQKLLCPNTKVDLNKWRISLSKLTMAFCDYGVQNPKTCRRPRKC